MAHTADPEACERFNVVEYKQMLVNKTYPKHQALKVVKKQVAGGLNMRGICWNAHTGVNTIWHRLEGEHSLSTTLGRKTIGHRCNSFG